MHVQEMISSHPHVRGHENAALLHCIEECYDCAQACIACADACLGEDDVDELTQCIRLNLDCADVCQATGRMASRRTGSNERMLKEMIELCEAVCAVCEDECRSHAAHHDHCRICAEACHSCREACRLAAASITPS